MDTDTEMTDTEATAVPSPGGERPAGPEPQSAPRERLTGWGRTAPSVAEVLRPRTREQVVRAVAEAGPRGVIARGLGR